MKPTLSIPNWRKFQHYHDRTVVWIKAYVDLLMDDAWCELSDPSKAHVLGLWLLATRHDGTIPFKPTWIEKQIGATCAINWRELAESKFVTLNESASNLLADLPEYPSHGNSNNLASILLALARSREGEGEGEKNKRKALSASADDALSESVPPIVETKADPESVEEDPEAVEPPAADFDPLPESDAPKKKAKASSGRETAFESVWCDYPSKIGRKDAFRHFTASVKSDGDLPRIREALRRYKAHLALNAWKQPQNGSTWFNNWQDWENWIEPEQRNANDTRTDGRRAPGEGPHTPSPAAAALLAGLPKHVRIHTAAEFVTQRPVPAVPGEPD